MLGACELFPASFPPLLRGVPEVLSLPRAQPAAVARVPVGGHRGGLRPRPPQACRRRRLAGALLGAVHVAPHRRAGDHHSLLHGGLCTVEEAPAEPHHPGCTGHLCRRQAMAREQAACGSHGANLHLWDGQIYGENMDTWESLLMGTYKQALGFVAWAEKNPVVREWRTWSYPVIVLF